MDSIIKLFIADSNTERTNALIDHASADHDIIIVGHCTNGVSAFSMIQQTKPDVVIINLLLIESDGFSLIENINDNLSYSPVIICISPVSNDFIIKYAFELGVSYFMLLPVDISVLIKRINDVFRCKRLSDDNARLSPQQSQPHYIEDTVKTLLLEIGIPANLKGYAYLSYAICVLVEQNKISGKITKELYPSVAMKFNSTVSRVERGIRHAIDIAWCRGKIKNLNEIFGIQLYSDYEKPTSCEFISLIADRVTVMRNTNKL